MKAQLPSGVVNNTGRNKLDANYLLGEIGLAYSFDVKSFMPSAKAMTATFGYPARFSDQGFQGWHQPVRVCGISDPELRDTTEGFALGLSVSF